MHMFYGSNIWDIVQNVFQEMTVALNATFSFYSVFDIWRSSISACSLLPSIQWLSPVRRWRWGSGWRIQQFICTSLSLLLFNALPLANLQLALISTWVFIHFPLKILRLQCTYAIGCMGQAFSSWSLNNPRVLCPISRIEVMLVKAFTFTSGCTCYSSIGMFGLTGSLESDLPTEPEWMDCPMCSSWAWGGFHVPGRILLIFRIVSKRSYLTM